MTTGRMPEHSLGHESIERLRKVVALVQGVLHTSLKARVDALEAGKADLIAELADLTEPEPFTLHPGMGDTYASAIADLAATLHSNDTREEAADILRGLIEKMVLTPNSTAQNAHSIELGAILTGSEDAGGTNAQARRGMAGSWQLTMVTGAGCIEEPTILMAATGGKPQFAALWVNVRFGLGSLSASISAWNGERPFAAAAKCLNW